MDESAGEKWVSGYDLVPSVQLIPRVEPMRHPGTAPAVPRYVPGPLAEGMARVILDDDYYAGTGWRDYAITRASPREVFDIPLEQRDRWCAAIDAYQAMQEEIGALIDERGRNPLPRPSPGLPF